MIENIVNHRGTSLYSFDFTLLSNAASDTLCVGPRVTLAVYKIVDHSCIHVSKSGSMNRNDLQFKAISSCWAGLPVSIAGTGHFPYPHTETTRVSTRATHMATILPCVLLAAPCGVAVALGCPVTVGAPLPLGTSSSGNRSCTLSVNCPRTLPRG